MLIRYACIDMGLKCPFIVKGETIEEVTRMALEHIREKHPNDFNNFITPEQIKSMQMSVARSTRLVEK